MLPDSDVDTTVSMSWYTLDQWPIIESIARIINNVNSNGGKEQYEVFQASIHLGTHEQGSMRDMM